MSVSKLQPQSGANNFTLDIGATGNTTFSLAKEYSPGAYSITSQLGDPSLDVYAYASDGSLAGYTNTKAFSAIKGFTKLVVLGMSANDLLSFEYKTTYSPTSKGTDISAGPFVSSTSTTSLPSVDDSMVIFGGNFATDVSVAFKGTDNVLLPAKSVTRDSETSITVVRPDELIIAHSPYTLIVTNPDVQSPSGSGVNTIPNGITAGTNPVWQTPQSIIWDLSTTTSLQILATDTENSTMTYSIVSGQLPAGLSLDSATGLISGNAGTSETSSTFTARATDDGGNYLDRQFTLILNYKPVWSTAAGALPDASQGLAYSYQLVATDASGSTPTFSLVSGSLPAGLTLSTSGLISGTPTSGNGNTSMVFRATDNNGTYVDRTFTIATNVFVTFTASGTYTVPSGVSSISYLVVAGGGSGAGNNSTNVACGGGGAGGYISGSLSVSAGQQYSVIVGAGGSGQATTNDGANGRRGGNSVFGSVTATGGGGGAAYNTTGAEYNGGSGGGGGNGGYGAGTAGQGNNGGQGSGQYYAGGGGGANAAGTGNPSRPDGGAGKQWINGSYYAGGGGGWGSSGSGSGANGNGFGGIGGGGSAPGGSGSANTGGGGGGLGSGNGGPGGSGIVIVAQKA